MSKAIKSKAIPLTPQESDLLAEHELIISQGLQAFVAVGLALVEIRDKKLYRVEYKTFEDYCAKRWDISRRRGYQLIEAAEVAQEMCTNGTQIEIENERQARALAMVPPHLRGEIVERLKDGGEAVTEQSVTKAVNKLLEDKRREAKEREQTGGTSDDEDEAEEPDYDADDADSEDDTDETPVERTIRRVAKKVEKERLYLARGLEHLRLAVKDLRKVAACDLETPEAIQAASEGLDTADEVFSHVRSLIAQQAVTA